MVLKVALDGEPLLARRTGISRFCEGLIGALRRIDGIDTSVYAVTWRTRPDLEALLPAGVALIGRPMPARPIRALWQAGLDAPLEWWTGRLDLVHGTNSIVPPTRKAARLVTVHDLSPLRFPEVCEPATLAYPNLIGRAIDRGAWVHTDSQFVADEVIEAFGVDPARVKAIPPGIPPLAEGGQAPDLGTLGRYILAIGTVEPRKDYPTLVRAFDGIAGARPELGLVIVGADAWGAEPLMQAIERSPYRERIVRPGYLEDADLAALLRGAALLAYPSRYEGFGFPPLQAMAAGVPVVATAAGSVPEVVGPAAVLVPVGDADSLAEGLVHLLDDEKARAEKVAAGRQRAALFSWDQLAVHMSDLYGQVISGH